MARIDIDSYVGVDPFAGRDSTGAIQQAIADGERDGTAEYLMGPGTYLYKPLLVQGSNLTFHARGQTRLIFQPAPTGPRGHGVQLKGGPSASLRQHHVRFEGFEMDGTLGGADTGAWDTGNKAFTQFGSQTAFFDAISYVGCRLHGWGGELIYGGGYTGWLGRVTIEDCELSVTGGDGISTSAEQMIRRNRIWRCAANGIEDTYDMGPQTITDNDIWDVGLDGIGVQTINANDPCGPSTVEGNRLKNCKRSGITGLGTRNAWVRRNTATDCGWATKGHGPLYFDQSGLYQGNKTADLHVRDNDVVVDRQALGRPLIMVGPTDGLDIEQPRVWRTTYAKANGLTVA